MRAPLVSTIREKCRMCYTCVRECPAKAIRISNGQAEVIEERCIGCGNCVRVCSQKAKQVRSDIPLVEEMLAHREPVSAILAPSFPAEFSAKKPERVIGAIRALGFRHVYEVAYGADLVAAQYRRLLEEKPDEKHIATSCPALISYIEKYHPVLVGQLAPIVSPMIATARALRELHGSAERLIFIGPCIAKKHEALDDPVADEIDAVLTFAELRKMFDTSGIDPFQAVLSAPDPPRAGMGMLFPISRGMLQTADLREDLVSGEIVAAHGRVNFVEAVKEFESGALDVRLLEILCCDGCIMGPGMTTKEPMFRRRSAVSQYARECLESRSVKPDLKESDSQELNLARIFSPNDMRIPEHGEDDLSKALYKLGKFHPEDELNCGACGYDTCREHAIAVMHGQAESEMCLPYTIERLRRTVGDLAESHRKLAETQQMLMQSERLASMGQLAAGIAHEVNNPLGVVVLYANILLDEIDRASDHYKDIATIAEQAERCRKIIAGLLNFSRRNKLNLLHTDITELLDGMMKVFPLPGSVLLDVRHGARPLFADIDPDQITQVITNLLTNAAAAMPNGGGLYISAVGDGNYVRIEFKDTGTGIATDNMEHIFEPFFTTKQMGHGTGLGLAVAYGIVKMHGGRIEVESNADPGLGPTGSTFTLVLPKDRESTDVFSGEES